jgi:hypothetical protein
VRVPLVATHPDKAAVFNPGDEAAQRLANATECHDFVRTLRVACIGGAVRK